MWLLIARLLGKKYVVRTKTVAWKEILSQFDIQLFHLASIISLEFT